ncbi:AMP-binding protein [Nonomuraea sp. NPDC003727]
MAAAAVVVARHTGCADVRLLVRDNRNGVHPIVAGISESTFSEVAANVAEQLGGVDSADCLVALVFDNSAPESGKHQPLALSVQDGRVTAAYDGELFSEAAIERFVRHVHVVLTQGNGWTGRVSRLPLPVESPAAAVPSPSSGDPVTSLGRVARIDPGRGAAADAMNALTYGRLAAVVEGCAQDLRAPRFSDARVGVLMDHDVHAVVGVLAVLRSGRTFVPLNAEEPGGRLTKIVADADIAAIMYPRRLKTVAERISKGKELIEFDISAPVEPSLASVPADAEQAACLLYTSGRNGRPTGVVQSRSGAVSHAATYAATTGLRSDDVVACLASPGSTTFVVNLFATLLAGASLRMVDPAQPVHALRSALRRQAVSVLHSTPTQIRLLLDGLEERDPSLAGVRLLVLGGEQVEPDDVRRIRAVIPGAAIINSYGTAECAVALQHRVNDADANHAAIAIGSPVPGVRSELLDADGEPTEVFGEIALTGSGVAHGYWRRDEATSEVFGPADGETRTFRTGDLAWRRPDGALVLAGRTDRRLIVQGHRVEPGEIEAQLRAHPTVAQALVADDASDPRALVAYVTAVVASAADAAELMRYLQRQMPKWSLPSRVEVLDVLPIGSDGEPDLLRLRKQPQAPASALGDAPATEGERAVAEIWTKVLRRTDLRVDQHFVRLGGDSLQLVRMIALVKERFGTKLEILEVLRDPTIRGIGRLVDDQAIPEGER